MKQIVFGNDPKVRIAYVACGTDFNMAISEDRTTLYGWGLGSYGNLGDGHKRDRDVPVAISVLDYEFRDKKRISMVSCGAKHCLALCEDSQVYS